MTTVGSWRRPSYVRVAKGEEVREGVPGVVAKGLTKLEGVCTVARGQIWWGLGVHSGLERGLLGVGLGVLLGWTLW